MLSVCLLAGCSGAAVSEVSEPPVTTAEVTTTVTTAQTETSVGAVAGEAEITAVKEEKPFVVAVDAIDTAYTPFTGSSRFDRLVSRLTGVTLAGRTRSGKTVLSGVTGERERYGGKLYEYGGIADILASYDEQSDTATYSFALRSDVRFADGETLDADDVIFSLYVLLDPSYSGDRSLYDCNITGAANYRYDSAVADNVSVEDAAEVLSSDDIIPLLREKLTLPTLEKQYETVETLYGDSSYDIYTSAYPDPNDLFIFFFSIDSSYEKPEGADKNTVISDIADMYGRNYRQLASMTVGNESAFDKQAYAIAVEYITRLAYDEVTPREHINSVSGIVRTGKYGLTVTVKGKGSEFEDALPDIIVAPLHYYGVDALYDYDRERFGFAKGGAAGVLAAHAGQPLGAGAYAFDSNENGRYRLLANPDHYGGAPSISCIELTGISADSDPAALIADGAIDAAYTDGSAQSIEAAEEANRSIEKIRTAVIGNGGYGYIGLNANTVNIGGKPDSEESIYLRKALATAISFYKESSVRAYFGENFELADYPEAGSVRAETSAEGYIPPYTVNADGEPIFTDEMTDIERRDAVKAACRGYLVRAGYTEDENGVIVSAPEGGRMSFSALIAAGGTGSHPAYGALTDGAALLGEIGITLTVIDTADPGQLWESVSAGLHEIWAGSWSCDASGLFPAGYYGVELRNYEYEISEDITDERERSEALYIMMFRRAVDDLAVDIPLYRRTSLVMFSALRVDTAAIAEDMTDAYDWTDEIVKLKLK